MAARERADEELSTGENDSDVDAGIDFCVFSCVEIFLQLDCCSEIYAVCKQLTQCALLRNPLIHTEAVVTASD